MTIKRKLQLTEGVEGGNEMDFITPSQIKAWQNTHSQFIQLEGGKLNLTRAKELGLWEEDTPIFTIDKDYEVNCNDYNIESYNSLGFGRCVTIININKNIYVVVVNPTPDIVYIMLVLMTPSQSTRLSISSVAQCSWEEKERNEMKRLNVMESYKDNSIMVIPISKEHEDDYALICMYNAHRNGTTDIRVGDKFVSLTQANAILKVMGLNYELYEEIDVDWNKVEEGTNIKVIASRNIVKFIKYIADLKTVIVREGDSLYTIDEDKVEVELV